MSENTIRISEIAEFTSGIAVFQKEKAAFVSKIAVAMLGIVAFTIQNKFPVSVIEVFVTKVVVAASEIALSVRVFVISFSCTISVAKKIFYLSGSKTHC